MTQRLRIRKKGGVAQKTREMVSIVVVRKEDQRGDCKNQNVQAEVQLKQKEKAGNAGKIPKLQLARIQRSYVLH